MLYHWPPPTESPPATGTSAANALAGQIFTVFVIVVAAAEAAIGLGIVIALYRNKETIWVDEIDLLKW